jgi:pyruvate dehydrogenase (quinone)
MSMSDTVSDFIVHRLGEWGITRLYGYPGDGINGVFGALRKANDHPRFIQTRHEEMAAFMACAHAKFTGEVGVCIATSGPGAIHLLNGLYDAKMDHQPVVALVGQSATTAMGSNYQQEVDLMNLFKDVAVEYCQQVSSPMAVRHVIDRAVRIALDQSTVTCVILPKDVQEEKYQDPPQKHDMAQTGVGHAVPFMIPQKHDLDRAADVLNRAQKVAMLIGQGATRAMDEVIQTAELLGAGVAKSWLGKAALPDDIPWCTGNIGLLGTRPSYDMMQDCDALLVVGSSFPYAEFYPPKDKAEGVQIDRDGRMLSLRYPMKVNLKGDAKETLAALLPLLDRKRERAWHNQIIKNVKEWWDLIGERAMNEANPINPQRVFHELSPRLPDNCILSADSGTAANWFARDIRIRRGMMASGSGNLASMGPAVPYAVLRRAHRRRRDADERAEHTDHRLEILEGMERSALGLPRAEQPRSEPGDVGAAHYGRGYQVRSQPGYSGFPVRALRRFHWPDGNPRRASRRNRRGVGARVQRRSASRFRSNHRSGRADASAAYQPSAGKEFHRIPPERRPR